MFQLLFDAEQEEAVALTQRSDEHRDLQHNAEQNRRQTKPRIWHFRNGGGL
jgi:hypothetical protein